MSYRKIFADGLWWNNPGLVQLLGICPLLAVSNTLINGLGLGLATIAVLCGTNGLVSVLRFWIPHSVRLPAFVLIIASFVTIVELLSQAYFYQLYLSLGIFIPLIVTNCTVLARAEAFASRMPVLPSVVDGLANGIGFAVLLTVLGAFREIIGQGSLFSGAEMLFGSLGNSMKLSIGLDGSGLLLAVLPPGAFLGLGIIIAAKNHLSTKISSESAAQTDLTQESP